MLIFYVIFTLILIKSSYFSVITESGENVLKRATHFTKYWCLAMIITLLITIISY